MGLGVKEGVTTQLLSYKYKCSLQNLILLNAGLTVMKDLKENIWTRKFIVSSSHETSSD